MTKETIINDLREISKTNSVSSYKRMVCEMAADTIENQAKALHALTLANMALKEKCRWIPVEEKMPEAFVSVLGYSPDEAPLPTVHECYIDKEGDWHRTSVFAVGRVTHWMPLPEGLNDEL